MSTAVEILSQSLETIEATYWVKKAEFVWKWDKPQSDKTPIAIEAIDNSGFNNALYNASVKKSTGVVGVCSIGAMSLAASVLGHKDDKTLYAFNTLIERDYECRRAAEALCEAIRAQRTARWTIDLVDRPAESQIIAWNDNDKTKRADVVTTFKTALESPLATADEIWFVAHKRAPLSSTQLLRGLAFQTSEEAGSFAEAVREDASRYKQTHEDPRVRAFARWVRDTSGYRQLNMGVSQVNREKPAGYTL